MGNELKRRGINYSISASTFWAWNILGALLFGIGPFVFIHKFLKASNMLNADFNAKGEQTFKVYKPVGHIDRVHLTQSNGSKINRADSSGAALFLFKKIYPKHFFYSCMKKYVYLHLL